MVVVVYQCHLNDYYGSNATCIKVIVDQQKTTDAWNFDLGPFQVESKNAIS